MRGVCDEDMSLIIGLTITAFGIFAYDMIRD